MLRDLLLLVRAPLAAGAVANMLVGAALAHGHAPWEQAEVLALVVAATATVALYWAGMALNDWFDLERDRALAPRRPLPAGRIGAGTGLGLGLGLLGWGLLGATLAAWVAGAPPLRGLLGAAAVVAAVLAYDGGLKRLRHPGALAMGACRATNALLGPAVLGLPWRGWPLAWAGLLWLHVYGLTVVSTWEDEDAPPAALVWSWGASALAPLLLLASPVLSWTPAPAPGLAAWAALLPLLAVIGAQAGLAVEQGTRARGEQPTRALLRSLWLLDLAVVLGLGLWTLLLPMAGLWLAGSQGAKALFAPPRPAPPPPSPRVGA